MTFPGGVDGSPALTFLRDFANRHVRSLDDSSAPCTRTFCRPRASGCAVEGHGQRLEIWPRRPFRLRP